MNPVNEYPPLPQAIPQTPHGMIESYGTLLRQLLAIFSQYGFRLNRTVPKDGSEPMTGDLAFTGNGYGPLLTSPNGTVYRVIVNNDGSLSTEPA